MIHKAICNDLRAYSQVVIYGAGDNGRYLAEYLRNCQIEVAFFLDGDESKQGTLIEGIPCIKTDEITDKSNTCILATPLNGNDVIVEDLKKKGFKYVYGWGDMRQFISSDSLYTERYFFERPEEKQILEKNKQYRGKYKGKRCFVLGNGPSLKRQNLKLLKDEFVFTVNEFMRSSQFDDVQTNFHVWNDSAYFCEEMEHEQLEERLELFKKIGKNVISFFPYSKSLDFVRNNRLGEFLTISYYQENNRVLLERKNLNLTRLLPEMGTAVLSAISIAFYMGFSEIYLLGCDCTDILTIISAKSEALASAQYAYDSDDSVKAQVRRVLSDRPLELIYTMQMKKFAAFRKFSKICGASGIGIYNCTDGGILEGIPRKRYEDLFQENLKGKNNMKVAIFPAGKEGKKLYSILKNADNTEVAFFLDNDLKKKKQEVEQWVDIPVITPQEAKKKIQDGEIDKILVISSRLLSYSLDDFLRQLNALDISDYFIVPAYIFRKKQLDSRDIKNIFTKWEEFSQLQHLQFHVADQCNLNCRRCQHFSNIAKSPGFPEFESVERDFQRLKTLFSDINRIAILGGEPLLNPELGRYCEMARKAFPYSAIDIITNGLLVRTMSEELIEIVKKNDILINMSSYYPVIEPTREQIETFLRDRGIRYVIGKKVDGFSKKMTLERNGKPDVQFRNCRDRCCTMLRDGKLYPCYLPATISVFNEKFGTDIHSEDSEIDIYEPNITGHQIIERLSSEFDICNYCTTEQMFPWEQTKEATIEDWLV